jgi:hypothetical protein
MTPDMNVLEQFQRAQTTRRFAISARELGYIFIYSLTERVAEPANSNYIQCESRTFAERITYEFGLKSLGG